MNNIRVPLIRAALATALVGGAFAVLQPVVDAALTSDSVAVEAGAPLQATLLPTVVIVADANHPDVAAMRVIGEALPVTLMPTVRVSTLGGIAAAHVARRAEVLAAAAAPAARLPALAGSAR